MTSPQPPVPDLIRDLTPTPFTRFRVKPGTAGR